MQRDLTVRGLTSFSGCVARVAARTLATVAASLGVAALLLETACYSYQVKAPSDLAAGQAVEVQVNNRGRVALQDDLGDDVAALDGDVVAVTDSALRVRVTNVDYINGTSAKFTGSEISVPRATITTVSTKQFSRPKSAVVAIGLTAALIAAISAFGLTGSSAPGLDSKPGGVNGGAQ